jgi:hypothetical protein
VKEDTELYAFRRHLRTCHFFGPGGREIRADKCNCPFHVDGLHRGERVRQSLRTRSRQLADRRLAELKRKLDARLSTQQGIENAPESGQGAATAATLTLSEAAARFLKTHGEISPDGKYRGDSEYGTWKKYRCALRFLVSFGESATAAPARTRQGRDPRADTRIALGRLDHTARPGSFANSPAR